MWVIFEVKVFLRKCYWDVRPFLYKALKHPHVAPCSGLISSIFLLLGSKLDPRVIGNISFFEIDVEASGLDMLFVMVVNALEVGANVGHLFFDSFGI